MMFVFIRQSFAASSVMCADVFVAPSGHELGTKGPRSLSEHQASRSSSQHVPGEYQRS